MLIYNGLKIKNDELGLALWKTATQGCQNLNQQFLYLPVTCAKRILTLKLPITTAADDILNFFFSFF